MQAQPTHTLVFVSTDGGDFGALGAAHFAESSPYRENALAVISLDAIAGAGRPRLLIAGDTARSPSAALVRTAAVRVLEQAGTEPLRDSAVRQLLDLGFPFTLGEQGPFVARGIPAVTLTTLSDDIPRSLEQTAFDDTFSVQRLAELGRAAQNLIGSLDAGLELAQGTTSYIYFGTRIVRGWAIELVLMTALLPFLIGTIDLFAHCRRRRIALAPAARSLRPAARASARRRRSTPYLRRRRPSGRRPATSGARLSDSGRGTGPRAESRAPRRSPTAPPPSGLPHTSRRCGRRASEAPSGRKPLSAGRL